MLASPPIFIIGNPRSGTTLLRLMLTSHREIVVPPECGFMVWWYTKYSTWTERDGEDPHAIADFLEDMFQSRKIETWNLDRESIFSFLISKKPVSYADLISLVYEYYGHSLGRTFSRWGDKNNFHIDHIQTIRSIFPQAWFVHIVRDGRDVASSYLELAKMDIDSPYAPHLSSDIDVIANEWSQNLLKIRGAFASFDWQQVIELRFEDLVLDTETQLRAVCQRIGEDFDGGMLNYYELNRKHSLEPEEFIRWKRHTLSPPRADAAGRYQRDLSFEQVKRFTAIAGDMLNAYDYHEPVASNG